MESTGFDSPLVFILTVDRHIFFWVVSITFFFALSLVAIVSKGRKWHELLTLFFVVYVASLILASSIFGWLLNLSFARLETVTLP